MRTIPELPCLLLLALALTASGVDHRKSREDLLEKVVGAVEAGVKFFLDDFSSINLDGLFGLRVGQGQVLEATRIYQRRNDEASLPQGVLERLLKINASLTLAADGAMPYLKSSDPEYYYRFGKMINRPYRLKYRHHHISSLDSIPVGHDLFYAEDAGDECFSRVLGTFVEDGRTLPKCNLTGSCLEMMTSPDTSRYFITHQLLYFIIVEQVGCEEVLDRFQYIEGLRNIKDKLCSVIYKETLSEVSGQDVPLRDRDLFLEQSLLCGCLGYDDFVKPDWIRMVIRWQAKDGCFKYGEETAQTTSDMLSLLNTYSTRKLQREQGMKDGCLSHMTGLGFGTLCLYLRVLIQSLLA